MAQQLTQQQINQQMQQAELEKLQLENQLRQSQTQLNSANARMAGRPADMKFNSLLSEDGTIGDAYALDEKVDTQFLDQMRDDNLRQPGEASAWRNLIDQQITRQAGDSATQMQQAQNQQLDNMAMRGGVSAGARERMAQAGVGQNLANQQNIFGNRLQADLQDEQMRRQGLMDLGNAEMQVGQYQTGIQESNRDAALQDIFQNRAFDTNQYNEKMRAWASEKTAAATPSGGGGGKK